MPGRCDSRLPTFRRPGSWSGTATARESMTSNPPAPKAAHPGGTPSRNRPKAIGNRGFPSQNSNSAAGDPRCPCPFRCWPLPRCSLPARQQRCRCLRARHRAEGAGWLEQPRWHRVLDRRLPAAQPDRRRRPGRHRAGAVCGVVEGSLHARQHRCAVAQAIRHRRVRPQRLVRLLLLRSRRLRRQGDDQPDGPVGDGADIEHPVLQARAVGAEEHHCAGAALRPDPRRGVQGDVAPAFAVSATTSATRPR